MSDGLNLPFGTAHVGRNAQTPQRVLSDGLYIVFQWIEQRRREINEYGRQYAENMMKSFSMLFRRLSTQQQLDSPTGFSPQVPKFVQTLLYGVPGTTRRRRYFTQPNHERARLTWNTFLSAISGQVHVGLGDKYYLPGL